MRNIFVFGSNKAGRHGKGAALCARNVYGAEYGVGKGLTGNAYAIPTKGFKLEVLPVDEIALYVDEFISFAKSNPDMLFSVTRVGCGLAGYKDHQIAPLFKDAPDNCVLDEKWLEIIRA